MKPLDRDLGLISAILADHSTLLKRIERFGVTEKSFVEDRSDDGELAYDAVMSPVYRIAEGFQLQHQNGNCLNSGRKWV